MRVSEALGQVSKAYIPGMVAYYERFNPDPWMQAHEDLERVMQAQNLELNEVAAVRFVERCTQLVERFKREGSEAGTIAPQDAIHMTTKAIGAWMSRKHKICAYCEGTESLKIVS